MILSVFVLVYISVHEKPATVRLAEAEQQGKVNE